jgi:purine-binding chemotaxis protein CheW
VERELHEVLIFEIGGQRYGLPAADVQELVRAVALTRLPTAPPVVEGLINLRGTLVPVLDIRARFHLPGRPIEPSDHLVIARAAGRLVALRVDRALELARLQDGDVESAEGVMPGVDYLAHVAKLPSGLVLIYDLQNFLSQAEALALDKALPAAGGTHP